MPRRPRALAVEHATTTNGLQQSTHCGSTTSHLLPSTRGQSRSRPVRRSESEAVYVPPSSGNIGDLLYVGNGSIEARSFDAERRMLSGDGRTLALQASEQTPYHSMMLSASAAVLAFTPSPVPFGAAPELRRPEW
jgi:hypothetical protein